MIRQHTHTPGCVIGLPCGADVKSLTELHAAMTQITENVIEPKPQWQKTRAPGENTLSGDGSEQAVKLKQIS